MAAPVLLGGVALLVLIGTTGAGATAARLVAALAFAVFAGAVTVTCWPVAKAAHAANAGPTRRPIMAVAVWFPLAVWGDVVIVATATVGLLDAAGLAVFLGVLAQVIATVLTSHAQPRDLKIRGLKIRGPGSGARHALARARLGRRAAKSMTRTNSSRAVTLPCTAQPRRRTEPARSAATRSPTEACSSTNGIQAARWWANGMSRTAGRMMGA